MIYFVLLRLRLGPVWFYSLMKIVFQMKVYCASIETIGWEKTKINSSLFVKIT